MELKKQDIINMIGMIKANYPNSYKDSTKEDFKIIIDLWFDLFKDYNKEIIGQAFKGCLLKCKLPPTIADMQEQIDKILEIGKPADNELWMQLENAVKEVIKIDLFNGDEYFSVNGTIRPKDEVKRIFEELPDILKTFVGSYLTLWSYKNYDITGMSIEKTRFMKELPKLKEKMKIAEQMLITNNNTKQIENK